MHLALSISAALAIATGCNTARQSEPVAPEAVKVTKVTTGLRKGGISFSVERWQEKGTLIYIQDRQALLFNVALQSTTAAGCDVSIADKIALLKPLLKKFFEVQGRADGYAFAFADDSELELRIVSAALRSGGWDTHAGRPNNESAAQFLKGLLTTPTLYPELANVIHDFGYTIKATDVDHVMVESAGQCDALVKGGNPSNIESTAKVPCSMSVRYTMVKTGN
jgi:hypothetical protein